MCVCAPARILLLSYERLLNLTIRDIVIVAAILKLLWGLFTLCCIVSHTALMSYLEPFSQTLSCCVIWYLSIALLLHP